MKFSTRTACWVCQLRFISSFRMVHAGENLLEASYLGLKSKAIKCRSSAASVASASRLPKPHVRCSVPMQIHLD